jgi:hypothetical protein
MEEKPKKKRGAPKGNTNARKHNFYTQILSAAEQRDMSKAEGISGIDEEVDLLRVKIKEAIEKDPENVKLLMEATKTLAGLLKDKYHINRSQQSGFKAGLEKVIKEVATSSAVSAVGAAIARHI